MIYDLQRLEAQLMQARVIRARRAIGRGTRYGLGQGGFRPTDLLPTNNGLCDCSGFAAWVLGLDRWQGRHTMKAHRNAIPWIETTAIYNDAMGANRLFVRVKGPVPGCLVVYPDRRVLGIRREGHVGVVDNVRSATDYDVIHCSVGNDRRGDAIQRTKADVFTRVPQSIFVTLKQDVKEAEA